MKLEGTNDKLDEARFFLDRLRHVQDPRQPEHPKTFLYHLSAFLGASHSVRYYLKAEHTRSLRRARKARKQIQKHYNDSLKSWTIGLNPEERKLWREFGKQRGREVHAERTKTVTKDRAVPVGYSDYSERARAFAAIYVMQQRGIALFSPDVTEVERRALRLPMGTTMTRYVQEHFVEIEGFEHAVLTICDKYVRLLAAFVHHFEQLVS